MQRNSDGLPKSVVTTDETWVYSFTVKGTILNTDLLTKQQTVNTRSYDESLFSNSIQNNARNLELSTGSSLDCYVNLERKRENNSKGFRVCIKTENVRLYTQLS